MDTVNNKRKGKHESWRSPSLLKFSLSFQRIHSPVPLSWSSEKRPPHRIYGWYPECKSSWRPTGRSSQRPRPPGRCHEEADSSGPETRSLQDLIRLPLGKIVFLMALKLSFYDLGSGLDEAVFLTWNYKGIGLMGQLKIASWSCGCAG